MDERQFHQVFEAHGPVLLLYARQWLERSAAEDVVQEAFLKLLGVSRVENVRAWLFAAVRNAAVSRHRHEKSRSGREMKLARSRLEWFEPGLDDLMDADMAQHALELLEGDQREVIVMRIWGEMTLAQISQITGCPVSTLHSRYQTGLTTMRKWMESSCKTKKT